MRAGSCNSASREAPTTSGSASTDIMIPALRNDWPLTVPLLALPERNPNSGRAKINSPNSASTMLGIPAIVSIADSTARASHRGRAYSTSHTAIPTPGRRRDPDADRGEDERPDQRVEEAARSALSCSAPVEGDSTNRLGRSAEIPLMNMNSTIPDRHHAQPDPHGPAQPVRQPVHQRPRRGRFAARPHDRRGRRQRGPGVAIRCRSRSV